MITLKTNSTFGNFAIVAEAEVSDAQRDTLAGLGLLQVLQRSPASAAEKKLAGYDKRPSGFKRDSIPFSAENAQVLAEAMGTIELGEGDTFGVIVDVTEYVPSEADVKMPDERAAYARNAVKLDKLAKAVGYAGDLGDGNSANAPAEFLRAIRAWSKARLAALSVE